MTLIKCPKKILELDKSILFIICFTFLKYILLIMLLQLSHFFSPLYSPPPSTPPKHPPLAWFMSMGRTYKFFSFSISYWFLTSPSPFCTHQLCFLFPEPCSPFLPLSYLTNNPPWDLHFCDSVPVLVA